MSGTPVREGTERGSQARLRGLLDAVRCPLCSSKIDLAAQAVRCRKCGQVYPRLGAIPVLLPEPLDYFASCMRQLAGLEEQVERVVQDVGEQLRSTELLPSTRKRCRIIIEGITGQLADVRGILEPGLPAAARAGAGGQSERIPATLDHLPYLYRDWGWPPQADGETERALALVETLLENRCPGRMLVMGAGACRLAYDVYHRHPDSELLVMDLDPVLFSAAHAVTHGESVTVREANLEMGDLDQAVKEWALSAPRGPVDDARFHFLVADAVDPPLTPGIFDTVLTPWFIDHGPEDVRDLISTLHRMLKPGGRWVNLGPLKYNLDVPFSRRFAREELFDLAERAGFHVGPWHSESGPYLVSQLNGRGKTEWVLAFSATKLEAAEEDSSAGSGPPPWLLFRHLPIPAFEGQAHFWSEAAMVRMVVSSIDGRRTLDDIAVMVSERARQPDITMSQVRAAVRQCLQKVHPACGAAG
ncbi:MAG: methyltransferase domain-containing protein [Gemmatimonadota bacterium]|nr:methyltransferase domain-containing protein [Gemmatimonadota bacterium]MDE2866386.1 methyltransferase domain-containing protein [Gemmatimonadota bacterium]